MFFCLFSLLKKINGSGFLKNCPQTLELTKNKYPKGDIDIDGRGFKFVGTKAMKTHNSIPAFQIPALSDRGMIGMRQVAMVLKLLNPDFGIGTSFLNTGNKNVSISYVKNQARGSVPYRSELYAKTAFAEIQKSVLSVKIDFSVSASKPLNKEQCVLNISTWFLNVVNCLSEIEYRSLAKLQRSLAIKQRLLAKVQGSLAIE